MEEELPNNLFLIGFLLFLIYILLTRRMSTINDLPEDKLNYIFYGIATRVGDGDGFRVYHVPWFRSSNYNKHSDKLPIRLAGIDAPEVGCF